MNYFVYELILFYHIFVIICSDAFVYVIHTVKNIVQGAHKFLFHLFRVYIIPFVSIFFILFLN